MAPGQPLRHGYDCHGERPMKRLALAALLLTAATIPAAAQAQQATINQTIAGTRLDISATGEVTRVPDIAIISTGVVTKSATAGGAISQAAARMARVRAALKSAGVEDRDIQTSNISLNPDYRYDNNQPPKVVGYQASNTVTVRFRDIASAGKIIDADDRQTRGCAGRSARSCDRDRPGPRRALCAVDGDAGGSDGCRERERRKLSCAAAAAGHDGSARPVGEQQDRSGRAEAAGQSGDDVRAAVRTNEKAARH